MHSWCKYLDKHLTITHPNFYSQAKLNKIYRLFIKTGEDKCKIKFNICNRVSHFRGENTKLDIKQFYIPAPVDTKLF